MGGACLESVQAISAKVRRRARIGLYPCARILAALSYFSRVPSALLGQGESADFAGLDDPPVIQRTTEGSRRGPASHLFSLTRRQEGQNGAQTLSGFWGGRVCVSVSLLSGSTPLVEGHVAGRALAGDSPCRLRGRTEGTGREGPAPKPGNTGNG